MADFDSIPLLPLPSNFTYLLVHNQVPGISDEIRGEAAADGRQSVPVTDPYRGSLRYPDQRFRDEYAGILIPHPMTKLTEQIAHYMYYNCEDRHGPKGGRYYDTVHKHHKCGHLIEQYEPISQLFLPQLEEIVKDLGPMVRTTGDEALGDLYKFVKELLRLKKDWRKAAGAFFGLLAYMDMMETWGVAGGGKSFPGEHGVVLIESLRRMTQEKHESTYHELETFKESAEFYAGIIMLQDWFDQQAKELEANRQRAAEGAVKTSATDRKREAVKLRNLQRVRRQISQSGTHMSLNRQTWVAARFSQVMHRMLETSEEEVRDGHWS